MRTAQNSTLPINASIADSGNDVHMNTVSSLPVLPGKRLASDMTVDYGPKLFKKARQPRVSIEPEKSFLDDLSETSEFSSSYSDNNTTIVPAKNDQSTFSDMPSTSTTISPANGSASYNDSVGSTLLNDSTFTPVPSHNTGDTGQQPVLTPDGSAEIVNTLPQSQDTGIMNNTTAQPEYAGSIMSATTARPEYPSIMDNTTRPISDADGIMTDTTARLEYPSIMDNTTRPLSHADTTDSEVQSGVSIYSKDYKDYFNDDNDGGAAGATPLERRDQWLDTSSFAAPHNRADISQKLPSRESLFTPAAYLSLIHISEPTRLRRSG